jgi:hypothetical protein
VKPNGNIKESSTNPYSIYQKALIEQRSTGKHVKPCERNTCVSFLSSFIGAVGLCIKMIQNIRIMAFLSVIGTFPAAVFAGPGTRLSIACFRRGCGTLIAAKLLLMLRPRI